MTGQRDDVERAFRGDGPLYEAMLAERARELAAPLAVEAAADMAVLSLAGRVARWALPLDRVARIDVLGPSTRVPDQPAAVLGLALLSGRRCLVADLEVLVGAASALSAEPAGHVVVLRGSALGLLVVRAEAVVFVPRPEAGTQALADGSLLLDVDGLAGRLGLGGGG
jgi:chemotaxis signal transduction protein